MPAVTDHSRRAALSVFVLTFLAGATFFGLQGLRWDNVDSEVFLKIADNLSAHHSFSIRTEPPYTPYLIAPAYPFFLAALGCRAQQPSVWAIWVQILLNATVATMIYFLARPLSSEWRAAAAALLYGLHPEVLRYGCQVFSEALLTALLVASVVLVIGAARNDRPWLSAFSGGLLGMATLCRSVGLLYLAMLLISSPFPIKRRFLHCGVLLLGFWLVYAPWTLHCTLVARTPLLMEPGRLGGFLYYAWRGPQFLSEHQGSTRAELDAAFVNDYSRRYRTASSPQESLDAGDFGLRETLHEVTTRPGEYGAARLQNYLTLMLSDCKHALRFHRWPPLRDRPFAQWCLGAICLAAFSLLPLAAGIVGMVGTWHQPASKVFGALWISTLLVWIPMWACYRYWLPVLPFLLANASCCHRAQPDPDGQGEEPPTVGYN